MTLRTERLEKFQSVAEIESKINTIRHASVRVRMRVAGDSGAVAGVFLYESDNNESDLEVLTKDKPELFRATNQPALDSRGQVIKDATSIIHIPLPDSVPPVTGGTSASLSPNATAVITKNGTRGDWNNYRMDWLPTSTEWIVNGQLVETKTYGVPKLHSHLAINLWSNGGSWSGEMDIGSLAYMDLEWIEMVYNITGEENKPCEVVCGVDEGDAIGKPKYLRGEKTTSGVGRLKGEGWLWSVVIGVVAWSLV